MNNKFTRLFSIILIALFASAPSWGEALITPSNAGDSRIKVFDTDKKLKGKRVKKAEFDGKTFEFVEGEYIVKNRKTGKLELKNAAYPQRLFDEIRSRHDSHDYEFAEPNYVFHKAEIPPVSPDDTYWYRQYGPVNIEADRAWNIATGSGVTVAIIDTGIDHNHPDLAGQVRNTMIDYVNDDDNAMDDDGHGTHCAGIVAAIINNGAGVVGVAPSCRLRAVKVLDNNGDGSNWDLYQGIIWAADHDADVISMSLSSSSDETGIPFLTLQVAVDYAHDEDCVLVAASGNNNSSSKRYPAACDDVIAVASVREDDVKAGSSNWGNWVDISAPGNAIYSTIWNDTYSYMSGTSMATPMVAGLAALILSVNPGLSPGAVENIIKNTADNIDPLNPGYEGKLGAGRINAYEALKYMINDSTPPSTPTLESTTHPDQNTWSSDDSPAFQFPSWDENGVCGFSYVTDQSPSTVPDTIPESTQNWQSFSGMSDGVWWFHVRACDVSDNWSGTAHYRVQIDGTPPSAPAPDDGIAGVTSLTSVTFSWPAVTDTAPVIEYMWGLDDPATPNATTETEITLDSLSEGTHTFYVKALNSSVLLSSSGYHSVTVDCNPPAAPENMTVNPSGWTNVNSFTVDWTDPPDASGIAGCYYRINSPPSGPEDGTWSTSHPLGGISLPGNGPHVIYVWLKDNAGMADHLNSSTVEAGLDAAPPSMQALTSSTHPAQTEWYSSDDPVFEFHGTDNISVEGYSHELDMSPATVPDESIESASESASYTGVGDGTWFFHVRAVDRAGNASGTLHYTAQIDSTPPTSPSPDDGITGPTTQTDITFSWASVTDTAPVTEYLWGFDDPAAPNSTALTAVTINGIADGTHTFYVKAVNASGLESPAGTHTVVVDTTPLLPPSPPENISVAATGVEGELELTWTLPADPSIDHVRVYRSEASGSLGTLVYDNVSTDLVYDQGLANGEEYFYTIRSVKASGIESDNTAQYSGIPVDTTPPRPFSLISPANGSTTTDGDVTCSWQHPTEPSGILKYELFLNGELKVSDIQPDTSSVALPDTLEPSDEAYEWRVIATDIYGNQRSSATWSFTVAEDPAPAPNDDVEIIGRAISAPNPFNSYDGTYFNFELSSAADITVRVFDLYGKTVWTKDCGRLAAGKTEIYWDGRSFSRDRLKNGAYIYVIMSGREVLAKGTLAKRD